MKGRSRYTRVRPGQEHHLAGVRALADGGDCARCHEPVLKEQRIVRTRKDQWIHAACRSGADDE